MGLKSIMYMAAMMAAAGMGGNPRMGSSEPSYPDKKEVDEKKRQELIKKGYKEFTINGEKILALSEKKAIQKASRKIFKD